MSRLLTITSVLLVTLPFAGAAENAEDSRKLDNLISAAARLAGDQLCKYLTDHFRSLQSSNPKAAIGSLWIQDCNTRQQDRQLTVQLGGKAWRWVYRERDAAGGEFSVSENVTFGWDLEVRGELDIAYDPRTEIITMWYRTQGEPEVTITETGEVEVEKEGLWSQVVGAAASMVGESPEQRADQEVKKEARQRILDRIDEGATATYDLCTGTFRTAFRIAEAGKMLPEPPAPENVEAHMHQNGLIITGPHSGEDVIRVSVDTGGEGAIHASLVCQQNAVKLAEAYYHGKTLPKVQALAEMTIQKSGVLTTNAEQAQCPVAIVTRAADASNKTNFKYRWHVEGAGMKLPSVACDKKVATAD